MKNTYKQLSSEERDKIAILRAKGLPLADIAEAIGRNKSTISRELQRNSALVYNVYLPHKADRRAKERKCEAGIRPRLKDLMIRQYVTKKLKIGWSPEQIAGRLSKDHPGLSIGHEAIYQYVYDKDMRKTTDLSKYFHEPIKNASSSAKATIIRRLIFLVVYQSMSGLSILKKESRLATGKRILWSHGRARNPWL